MTSPLPAVISGPVLIVITLLAIGRWIMVNDTLIDRLINRAEVAAIITVILREPWAQQFAPHLLTVFPESDVVNIMRQLSLGTLCYTIMYIYGIARLWSGADPAETWRRQQRYNLLALASTIVVLIAGTPARHANLLIDQALGWEAVIAWIAIYIPIMATTVLIIGVAVRDLSAADRPAWQEWPVYIVAVGLVLSVGGEAVVSTTRLVLAVRGISPLPDPEMHEKARMFWYATVGACVLIAIPLVNTLLTRIGWDRTSRYCRRLQPLWQDLTTAVPEIVLPPLEGDHDATTEPATRLHRRLVEIRDSLLHLRRYTSDPEAGFPTEPAEAVEHIIQAIEAKRSGLNPALPPRSSSAIRAITPGPRDLSSELRHLLDLSKAWQHRDRNSPPAPIGSIGTPCYRS